MSRTQKAKKYRNIEELKLDIEIEKYKDLENARDLIIGTTCINFDEKLAFRLLRLAIELKHELYTNDLIVQIPNFSNTQESGELIWHALSTRNRRIVRMLIEAGANVNVPKPNDPNRITFLQYLAAFHNDHEDDYNLALLTLDRGADLQAVDQCYNNVLHYAVGQDECTNRYSFVLACELIHRGARIDAVNRANMSVIKIAASNFSFDGQMCPLLIAFAKVDDHVKRGWIIEALKVIAEDDRDRINGLYTLLLLGFPMLTKDYEFTEVWQPVYYAVVKQKSKQLITLLDYGANVNIKFDFRGQVFTPLHLALYFNMKVIINILIMKGADIHAMDDVTNERPIHIACRSSSIESVRLLLRLGANINVFDRYARTPYSTIESTSLLDNLRECLIERFALLKEKGIKINRKDWKRIREEPRMLRYYNRCTRELQKMKSTKINHSLTLLSVIVEDFAKIWPFARNMDFIDSYYENKQKIKAAFPLYYRELEHKVKMAEARNEFLLAREQALFDVTGLPGLVVTKIVKYSFDDLSEFEKLYHVSMRKL